MGGLQCDSGTGKPEDNRRLEDLCGVKEYGTCCWRGDCPRENLCLQQCSRWRFNHNLNRLLEHGCTTNPDDIRGLECKKWVKFEQVVWKVSQLCDLRSYNKRWTKKNEEEQ